MCLLLRKEIKKFSEIYEKEYNKEEELEDGYFILSGENKKTNPMKELSLINYNDFLNDLNDVFVFKIITDRRDFYMFYFIYKGIKMKVHTCNFKNLYLRIKTEGEEWRHSDEIYLNQYNLDEKEVEFLKKNISINIKNNTRERLKFLLNEGIK